MAHDPIEERFDDLSDKLEFAEERIERLEQEEALRLFYARGGTDEEFMKEQPSQRWETAKADACLEDERATAAGIADALERQSDCMDDDQALSNDRLDGVERDLAELDQELDRAAGANDRGDDGEEEFEHDEDMGEDGDEEAEDD